MRILLISAAFQKRQGDDVRRANRQGESIGYDQDAYKAKVVLEISGEYDRLPLDSSADILTAGLLGEKYIGIVPGGDPAMLQNGDTIQYTGSSMVLEKLIQQFVTQMSAKDDASKSTPQEPNP